MRYHCKWSIRPKHSKFRQVITLSKQSVRRGKVKQNPITNGKVSNVKPHSHNCIKFQITPTGDRYQLACPNSTHLLATIKSLTKINLQELESSKAKPQQKIAYSHPASETSLITVHFTDQTQYYCKQSEKNFPQLSNGNYVPVTQPQVPPDPNLS